MSIQSRSVLTVISLPPEVEVVKLRFGTSVMVSWLTVCPHRQPALIMLRLVRPEKLLAVVGMDQKVEVWDLEKKQARTLAGHTAEITSVDLVGALLISAGRDKTIRTWSVETGAAINSWETPSEINGIAVIEMLSYWQLLMSTVRLEPGYQER